MVVFLVLQLIYADLSVKKCITLMKINNGNYIYIYKKKNNSNKTPTLHAKILDGPTGFVSFMQNSLVFFFCDLDMFF